MKLKLKVISIISALCFLGSVACFSAVAADVLSQPSGDEEYVESTPTEQYTPDPVTVDPVTPDPGYVEPTDPEPVYSEPNPGYDPGTTIDPTGPTDNSEYYPDDPGYENNSDPTYSATYSDVISEGNFPQPVYSVK